MLNSWRLVLSIGFRGPIPRLRLFSTVAWLCSPREDRSATLASRNGVRGWQLTSYKAAGSRANPDAFPNDPRLTFNNARSDRAHES